MSFSKGPYSAFTSLPSPDRPSLSSSRKINFATGRFVFGSNGEFAAMPSTVQRVAILVAQNVDMPDFITEQNQERVRQDVGRALESLGTLIENVRIEVSGDRPGVQRVRVEFRDVSSGLDQTVQL